MSLENLTKTHELIKSNKGLALTTTVLALGMFADALTTPIIQSIKVLQNKVQFLGL